MLQSRNLLILVTTMALFSSGCDITFKRKSSDASSSSSSARQHTTTAGNNGVALSKEPGRFFSKTDKQVISEFFNAGNEQILLDNHGLTKTSDDLRKQIRIGARLPATIQLLPLPLALEGKLTPAKGSLIRIQVEYNIILLDIRSRIIMDMFKLNPENKR